MFTLDSRGESISVIIPIRGAVSECRAVLEGVIKQVRVPKEIILIMVSPDSGDDSFFAEWSDAFAQKFVSFQVFEVKTVLFPGAARNVGLQYASEKWLAFLDVDTIPCEHWLHEQIKRIDAANSMGSFGSTTYAASTFIRALVRDAIYGRRPIRTLPGSVLKKDLFNFVGQFIPNIRAAEDTEWMIRAEAMGVKIADTSHEALITYNGLMKFGLRGLVKKWRRNYLSSRQLQHLKVQATIVWLLGYFVVSLIAFNWNAILAGWQVNSPFYIDHVTKIVSLTPVVAYIVFRGCYLPHRRGVPLSDILPFRFLLLVAVAALLDAVKVTTILLPRSPS